MKLLLPLTLLATGCLAEVKFDADSDGDGLSDASEASLGSDPGNPDSDGDTWLDGEEAESNTDPINPDDHPYTGGWAIGDCRADVESTGNAEGEVANDFSLMDQYGEMVSLHSFCDRVVYMVFAAFW